MLCKRYFWINNFSCKYFSTNKILNTHDNELKGVIDEEASRIFIKKNVQSILRRLTGMDLNKVFRSKAIGRQPTAPAYKFMTSKDVKLAERKAITRARRMLQMPPVVPIRNAVTEILEEVPELIGFDSAKYIFTDVTFGVSNRERIIVVREPSGVLRKANGNERHRMCQIYFPQEGRTIFHPRMFQEEYLAPLLDKEEYEFILDRACCQFEPDDPEYHDVTLRTYKHINERKTFNKLRSTRHYGPLLFCLFLNKNIDNLLLENMQTDRITDAIKAIRLYRIINPSEKLNELVYDKEHRIEFIKKFVESECKNKTDLLLALQICTDDSKIDDNYVEASSS